MRVKAVLSISTMAALATVVLYLGLSPAHAQTAQYVNAFREFRGPLVYKSPKSGVLFYIESDGRHISALDPLGKIIWTRDPVADTKMKPYRFAEPQIVWIGEPQEWMVESMARQGKKGEYVAITFNASQFGVVDTATGEFTFQGQD
jgi:hypothetical protein